MKLSVWARQNKSNGVPLGAIASDGVPSLFPAEDEADTAAHDVALYAQTSGELGDSNVQNMIENHSLVKDEDEKLALSQWISCCQESELILDRGENTTIVLASLYGGEYTMKVVTASCAKTLNAYGESGSNRTHKKLVRLSLRKQNMLSQCHSRSEIK